MTKSILWSNGIYDYGHEFHSNCSLLSSQAPSSLNDYKRMPQVTEGKRRRHDGQGSCARGVQVGYDDGDGCRRVGMGDDDAMLYHFTMMSA